MIYIIIHANETLSLRRQKITNQYTSTPNNFKR